MADSGRGSKEARRRSSKHHSKSSLPDTAPAPTRSRPKSDVNGSSRKHSRRSNPVERPLLQDRTHSEPTGDTEERPRTNSNARNISIPQSETFLLRPSIDHPVSPAISPAEFERLQIVENGNSHVVGASGSSTDNSSSHTFSRPIVCVIGAPGSGKSTFINQNASSQSSDDESDAPSFPASRSPDVTFQEFATEDVEILDNGSIEWPASMQRLRGQTIRGVVVLYDVTNPKSLQDLQNIIRALSEASIPTALVASKCDYPPNLREIDPDEIEKAVKSIFDNIQVFRVSQLASEGARACVSSLINGTKDGLSEPLRRSPASSDDSYRTARPTPHVTTTSAPRSTDASPPAPASPASARTPTRSRLKSQTQLHLQTSLAVPDIAGDRSPRSFLDLEDSPRPSFGNDFDRKHESEQDGRGVDGPEEDPFSPTESGVTFEELTNHLLYPPADKNDSTFESAFLCFYRFFAPPLRLLDAVIKHFEAHDGNTISPWVHEPILDRDLSIIDKWIGLYPGDFAKLVVRQKLRKFLARVTTDHGVGAEEQAIGLGDGGTLVGEYGQEARLAQSASQITLALRFAAEDDDTEWACSDGGPLRRSRSNTFLSISSMDSNVDYDPADLELPLTRITSSNPAIDAKLIFGGQSTRTLTAMGRSPAQIDSGSSSRTLLNVAESAQRQATLLSPNPTQSFGKSHWRAFISHSDDFIARELTRIDWIMFSSIRPRDLIRHVTVSVEERTCFNSLENVSRMIDHFNHLAYWVTNVVLYRDKPKHRAQALEKFMHVARKLRDMNNYNALGAIIAGIQGTAVHRLKATKELVSPDVQKDFMKLEILMAATKGHSSYRLAWENTSSERIPFLPLHRRDLVVAAGAGKTFVGGDKKATSPTGSAKSDGASSRRSVDGGSDSTSKHSSEKSPTKTSRQQPPLPSRVASQPDPTALINWRKFTIMGDILHNLTQAQLAPYVGFSANEEIRALVLDHIIIKDDDRLYERSIALEPPAPGGGIVGSGGGSTDTRKKIRERIGMLVG